MSGSLRPRWVISGDAAATTQNLQWPTTSIATTSSNNQAESRKKSKSMEAPTLWLDNPLRNVKSEVRTNLSDIRRVLKAIREFNPDKPHQPNFPVYIKKVMPSAPFLGAGPRIICTYNPDGSVKDIPEPYQWEMFDKWSNKFVPLLKEQVFSPEVEQLRKRWLSWAYQWKEKAKGDPWEEIKTYPQNYLKVLWNKHILNRNKSVDNANHLWSKDSTWDLFTKKLDINRNELDRLYLDMTRQAPYTRENRTTHRAIKRNFPGKYHIGYALTSLDFGGWLERMYIIVYGESWNQRGIVLWNNRNTSEYEMEHIDSVFSTRRNGAFLLFPIRYVNQGLMKKCICCDDYVFFDNLFNLSERDHHGPIIKFVTDRYNPNKPKEEKSTAIIPNAGTGNTIKELVPSNPVTEQIKQDYLVSFESEKPKEPKEDIPPAWIYSLEGYIDYSKTKTKYSPFCRVCRDKVYRDAGKGPSLSSIVTRGASFLRNYTANPMDYRQLTHQRNSSTFNVGPNEQPKFTTKVVRELSRDTLYERTLNDAIAAVELERTNRRRREQGFGELPRPPRTRTPQSEPRVIGKQTVDSTLYLGVELEVTPAKHLREKVWQTIGGHGAIPLGRDSGSPTLHNIDKGFAMTAVENFLSHTNVGIMKDDGSIRTHGGFEIVSVPGTLTWHKEVAWNAFFKENYANPVEARLAPSSFINGWINNGGNDPEVGRLPVCGIHVHVSKAALTSLQLGKIITFFGDSNNREFLTQVAGRTAERYAPFKKRGIKDGKVLEQIGTGAGQLLGEENHHSAVNVNTQGKPTIEFRIFRSNVAKAGFFKDLEFVHAIVNWCSDVSMNNLTVGSFVTWVARNSGNYEYLLKWLQKKKYLGTTHKPNPEFVERKVIDLDTKRITLTKVPNPGYKPELEEAA